MIGRSMDPFSTRVAPKKDPWIFRSLEKLSIYVSILTFGIWCLHDRDHLVEDFFGFTRERQAVKRLLVKTYWHTSVSQNPSVSNPWRNPRNRSEAASFSAFFIPVSPNKEIAFLTVNWNKYVKITKKIRFKKNLKENLRVLSLSKSFIEM